MEQVKKNVPKNLKSSDISLTWLLWDGPDTVIWKIDWDSFARAPRPEWYSQAGLRRRHSRGTEEAGGNDLASSAFAINLSSLLAILLLVQSRSYEKSRPHKASRLLSSPG